MTFFLFSLAGTPPLAGWVAKFIVFRSLLDAGGGWAVGLAVIGVVNSVIALFYYAAVSKEMWMNPAPDGDVSPLRIPGPLLAHGRGGGCARGADRHLPVDRAALQRPHLAGLGELSNAH